MDLIQQKMTLNDGPQRVKMAVHCVRREKYKNNDKKFFFGTISFAIVLSLNLSVNISGRVFVFVGQTQN